MDKQKVIADASETSEYAKRRLAVDSAADEARSKADIEGLYNAYQKSIEDRAEMEHALMVSVGCFAGKDGQYDRIGMVQAVKAMRDVALDAIALAREIAMKAPKR